MRCGHRIGFGDASCGLLFLLDATDRGGGSKPPSTGSASGQQQSVVLPDHNELVQLAFRPQSTGGGTVVMQENERYSSAADINVTGTPVSYYSEFCNATPRSFDDLVVCELALVDSAWLSVCGRQSEYMWS